MANNLFSLMSEIILAFLSTLCILQKEVPIFISNLLYGSLVIVTSTNRMHVFYKKTDEFNTAMFGCKPIP